MTDWHDPRAIGQFAGAIAWCPCGYRSSTTYATREQAQADVECHKLAVRQAAASATSEGKH